jgi:hypothetical protein
LAGNSSLGESPAARSSDASGAIQIEAQQARSSAETSSLELVVDSVIGRALNVPGRY